MSYVDGKIMHHMVEGARCAASRISGRGEIRRM